MSSVERHLARGTSVLLAVFVASACDGSSNPSEPPPTHPGGTISQTTPLGGRPYGVAISSAGVVYVTQLDSATVTRFSLQGDLGDAVSVGQVPTDVTFSQDGNTAYATDQLDSDLDRIAVSTGTSTGHLPVPANTFRVRAPGSSLYITGNDATVYVRARASGAFIADIPVGQDPNGLAFHPDGKQLFVSNYNSGSISVISRATNTVTVTHTIGGAPQDIAVDPQGKELYIADQGGGVMVVNLVTGNWLSPTLILLPGGVGTFGLAISPDGARVYVSAPTAGVVYVINPSTKAVVDTLETGGAPRRIAFSASGAEAVISNENGWVDFVN
jgi:YVTN family beta-propeller protein